MSDTETVAPSTVAAGQVNTQDNEAFEMDYDLAPPSYDEVINSTRYPIVRSATRNRASSDNSWRLDFVDFTPHLQGNPGNKQIGNFG